MHILDISVHIHAYIRCPVVIHTYVSYSINIHAYVISTGFGGPNFEEGPNRAPRAWGSRIGPCRAAH